MVTVRIKFGRDQEYINSKLRPFKRRFPRGNIPGAQEKMKRYGINELRYYRTQFKYRFLILLNLFKNLFQIKV